MKNKPIYKKILKIMKAINSIEKKGHNDYDNYSYATDADIKTAVRKELINNGLIFKHEILEEKTRGDIVMGKMNVLVRIKVGYTFTDVDTGDTYEGFYYGHGTDKGDKGLYKAITGSIKYILTSTFLIPTGDDPEKTPEKEEPFKGNEYVRVAPSIKERNIDKAMNSDLTDMEKLKYILNGMGGNTESSALLLLKDKVGIKNEEGKSFEKFKDIPQTKIATALTKLTK